MYISEFVCGVFFGAVVEMSVLIALTLWTSKKKK